VGVYMTRALACEVVACDLTSSLSASEALQYLCHELSVLDDGGVETTEETYLLSGRSTGVGSGGIDVENGRRKQYEGASDVKGISERNADGVGPVGMTTLEIAVLADCKKFISHRPVQKIINGM